MTESLLKLPPLGLKLEINQSTLNDIERSLYSQERSNFQTEGETKTNHNAVDESVKRHTSILDASFLRIGSWQVI